MSIVEQLRERTALRYMGDCKCGKCQLVPKELINTVATEIERLQAERSELWEALRVAHNKLGLYLPEYADGAFSVLTRLMHARKE